jgi:alkylhydroperoxidase family enzyme
VDAKADRATVQAVVDDWRTASVSARVRAALAFLEKLTLTPDAVSPEDVVAARAAGISDAALREVMYVCLLFSVMDRLADAFGFAVADARELQRGAWVLRHFGYARMSVPG